MKGKILDNPDIILKESKGLLDTYENTKTGEQYHVLGELAFVENGSDYTKKVKIEVLWSSDISIKKQLVMLMKICPELTKLSRTEILKEIKKENTWKISGFELWRAIEIKEECVKEGLDVSIID